MPSDSVAGAAKPLPGVGASLGAGKLASASSNNECRRDGALFDGVSKAFGVSGLLLAN